MIVQETEVRNIPVSQLVLDLHCQMRNEISWIAVQEYADAMEDGDEFPPVVVFWHQGGKYYVADGFHRVHAAKKLGRHFLGFEISPEYCRIAEERIALVEMQPTLFEKKAE